MLGLADVSASGVDAIGTSWVYVVDDKLKRGAAGCEFDEGLCIAGAGERWLSKRHSPWRSMSVCLRGERLKQTAYLKARNHFEEIIFFFLVASDLFCKF